MKALTQTTEQRDRLKRYVQWAVFGIFVVFVLSSCQSVFHRSAIQAGNDIDDIIAAGVCDVWSQQSYDNRVDSRETVDEIKRNNAARNAYCQQDTKR